MKFSFSAVIARLDDNFETFIESIKTSTEKVCSLLYCDALYFCFFSETDYFLPTGESTTDETSGNVSMGKANDGLGNAGMRRLCLSGCSAVKTV